MTYDAAQPDPLAEEWSVQSALSGRAQVIAMPGISDRDALEQVIAMPEQAIAMLESAIAMNRIR